MGGELTRFGSGNTARQKYTPEMAEGIFEKVLDEIKEDDRIYYINQALNRFGYYPNLMLYLLNQYPANGRLIEVRDQIMSILEERVVIGSLTGKIKEATAIFLMKTRFGFVEKTAPQKETKPVAGEGIDWAKVPVEKVEQLKRLIISIKQGQANDDEGSDNETQEWLEG